MLHGTFPDNSPPAEVSTRR